ncbi:pilus assembly protein CpaE [Tersicoccus phoenicis]|uniref:Pilus assembly protein CpaE n=1 Tax=Tersicoccus phoenicis TaxID=554083 RepID=A0A1R1LJS8_9MICC|nr:AAA family ATPase [Tersicoccus phoenicis]OMH27716.1 pilus assembly protein CpaE [Tersicoccus phoenicis]
MSQFLVISRDDAFVDRVAAATGGDLDRWGEPVLPADPGVLFSVARDGSRPDVVVLSPDVPVADGLALATSLDRFHPEITVLLVRPVERGLPLAAMRAGIRDLIAPGIDDTEFRDLLHRAARSAADRRSSAARTPGADGSRPAARGRVVVVLSPKGGAGKTTVATNLAIGLAASDPQSTVLVDLDLQFGDVAHTLQLTPEQTLSDAVSRAAARDTMVLKSFLSAHPTGIFAICAPDSPGAEAQITAEDITHLLDQLAAQYPWVVVDTDAGLSDATLAALDRATDHVFVAGTDVPSVRGLRKELDILRQLGLVPGNRHIVLNNADTRDGLSRHDIETTLGHAADVVVPFSRSVRLATNRGVPLLQAGARDKAGRTLRQLVHRFQPPTPKSRPTSTARHRRGTA